MSSKCYLQADASAAELHNSMTRYVEGLMIYVLLSLIFMDVYIGVIGVHGFGFGFGHAEE